MSIKPLITNMRKCLWFITLVVGIITLAACGAVPTQLPTVTTAPTFTPIQATTKPTALPTAIPNPTPTVTATPDIYAAQGVLEVNLSGLPVRVMDGGTDHSLQLPGLWITSDGEVKYWDKVNVSWVVVENFEASSIQIDRELGVAYAEVGIDVDGSGNFKHFPGFVYSSKEA